MNAASLVLVSSAGLAAAAGAQEISWSHRGAAGEAYGTALASVGDRDRDGIPDWAAGAPFGADDRGTAGGYVLVHSGRSGAELARLVGPPGPGSFGSAVAGAGDVDGDGIPDLLVGAPRADGNVPSAGYAAVYSGADGSVLLEFRGSAPYAEFGAAVAGIGDANGDGRPDLALGAPGDPSTGRDAGALAVFSGADGSLLHHLTGPAALARFGASVCGLGDLDGDRCDDFAVGAPAAGDEEQGSVTLFSGADGRVLRVEVGARPGGRFGSSLAAAGDLDRDGALDWCAGAPHAGSGSVSAFSGRDGRLLHHLVGSTPGSRFGTAVSGAGDLDGDGRHDFVVGSPRDGGGGPEAGATTAYSGADGSVLDSWPGEAGERAGAALAPLDASFRQPGFLAAGQGLKDNGVVRLRRWRPRGGAEPVPAVLASRTEYVPVYVDSPSSDVVTTRFVFYYWASGCGPWWGYPWAPYWWRWHSWCYWWGPPRHWWWVCWDPCWSCGYDPCCCGGGGYYVDDGRGGTHGNGQGGGNGSPPPPAGPLAARPSSFSGGQGAFGGGGASPPPGAIALAPTSTVSRAPRTPAGAGGGAAVSPPPAGSPPPPPPSGRISIPSGSVKAAAARPAAPAGRPSPAPPSASPPTSVAPPARTTVPARASAPPRSSSPPRSASPTRPSGSAGGSSGAGAARGGGARGPVHAAPAATATAVSRPSAPAPSRASAAPPRAAAPPSRPAPSAPSAASAPRGANAGSAGRATPAAAGRGSHPAPPARGRGRS